MNKKRINEEHLIDNPSAMVVDGLNKTKIVWNKMKDEGYRTLLDYRRKNKVMRETERCMMCEAMNMAFRVGKNSCLYCPLTGHCAQRSLMPIDRALNILNSEKVKKAAERINKEIRNARRRAHRRNK